MSIFGEEDIRIATLRRNREIILFSIISACWIAVSLVLLFLSPDKYEWYCAGNIVITILYGWFCFYFFDITFYLSNSQYKWCKRLKNSLPEICTGRYLRATGDITKSGVAFTSFIFLIGEDEREVLSFKRDLTFNQGEKYLLEMKSGIIVRYEVVNE